MDRSYQEKACRKDSCCFNWSLWSFRRSSDDCQHVPNSYQQTNNTNGLQQKLQNLVRQYTSEQEPARHVCFDASASKTKDAPPTNGDVKNAPKLAPSKQMHSNTPRIAQNNANTPKEKSKEAPVLETSKTLQVPMGIQSRKTRASTWMAPWTFQEDQRCPSTLRWVQARQEDILRYAVRWRGMGQHWELHEVRSPMEEFPCSRRHWHCRLEESHRKVEPIHAGDLHWVQEFASSPRTDSWTESDKWWIETGCARGPATSNLVHHQPEQASHWDWRWRWRSVVMACSHQGANGTLKASWWSSDRSMETVTPHQPGGGACSRRKISRDPY